MSKLPIVDIYQVVVEYEGSDGVTRYEYHGPYLSMTGAKNAQARQSWHQTGPGVRRAHIQRSLVIWADQG